MRKGTAMVAAQLCLDHPGAGLMRMGHCRRPASQASVREMEGSDALLAARLAAGDDRALAEVFDQLAPSVYGGALRVLGNGSAIGQGPDGQEAARQESLAIVTDAVGFCRLAANRVTPAELGPHITGDEGRAVSVLTAASTLALD
jgi:hypothetical protein